MDTWPQKLKVNIPILDDNEIALANTLISIGQSHLFTEWDTVGVNDEKKHAFFKQIKDLNDSYAGGGLSGYIKNATKLLDSAAKGAQVFQNLILTYTS